MNYIVDFNEKRIAFMCRVISHDREESTVIVDKWENLYGTPPIISGDEKIYRRFSSMKSDKDWIRATFEYLRIGGN